MAERAEPVAERRVSEFGKDPDETEDGQSSSEHPAPPEATPAPPAPFPDASSSPVATGWSPPSRVSAGADGSADAPELPAPSGWEPPPTLTVGDDPDALGRPAPPSAPGYDGLQPPPPLPELERAPRDRPVRHSRNPVDRLTRRLPNPLRITIDWAVTIIGAVAIVLLVKAFVVNPYRIPSSSMEATLHCAAPAAGCEARFSDRVLANRFLYRLRDPRRGEIIVFTTPAAAEVKCGAGGTFVKRVVGLPGDVVEVRLQQGDGYVYINGKPLDEPYIQKPRREATESFGPLRVKPDIVLHDG